ncbi:hypothetical protein P10159_1465 [Citrobacter portucalensis]|nr:hypothetical protein P10159_1465 [Citrobacter portucalensis]
MPGLAKKRVAEVQQVHPFENVRKTVKRILWPAMPFRPE